MVIIDICIIFSPSYVHSGCDVQSACNRLVATKFANAGQTCIAVDYVLVDAAIEVRRTVPPCEKRN